MEYYVQVSDFGTGDVSWVGPYVDVRQARAKRDQFRQDGNFALVYRSTVGVRAQVAEWVKSNPKEN